MQEPVNANSNRSELWSLSLRDLFYKYVRFLPVFLLSVALCLFIAYAYLRYATRIYSASGTMLIKNEQQGRNSSTDKFEDLFMNNKAQNIASEIEILKSRPLMERVVRRLGLQASYFAVGKLTNNNIYKQGPFLVEARLRDSSISFRLNIKFLNQSEFRINNDRQIIRFGQTFIHQGDTFLLIRNPQMPVGKEYFVDWAPASAVAGGLARSVQVTPKTLGTGILTISIQGTNPQLCADVVNQLMEEYIQYSVEQKNKASEQILGFINQQLGRYEMELDTLQSDLLAYQQRNDVIDIEVQSGDYFVKIGEADRTINEQQLKLNVADYIQDYLQNKQNLYNAVVVPSSLGLEDATLNELVAAYNKSQLERRMLLDDNIPEGNPSVKVVEGQIEQTRQSVLENLKNVKTSYSLAIKDLRSKSNIAQTQARAIPFKAKEYLERKQKVESKLGLVKLLQEEKEKTSISRAANIPNSNVIDKAGASFTPIKPNKKAIRILAILLGLGLPAMFIFISEVLNDKITTRFDIEKITPAPILGEIGHSFSSNSLIVNKTTRSMVAEQFRIIRSNLQYILNKIDKSVIMVTSSFSGEGKSFVTMNLGAVLALAGKKTVILEFDIRKPKILSGLGMPKRAGITNFLVGKAPIEELIAAVPEQENLFVLGCGPIPPNPSELLLVDRVEEMFVYLRDRFDVILVDTAPVGMVSDAQTLSKFVDCTLYLVRQGHTFKKQVALIDEFYQENKLPKVSIIINDVKVKPGYGYYGYGRYGYGYGYGYGGYYEEETPPQTFFERLLGWLDVRNLFRKRK
jgi:tyrosine-protein kinase Etk/Wzc